MIIVNRAAMFCIGFAVVLVPPQVEAQSGQAQTAIVGCNLLSGDGPEALFLQQGGAPGTGFSLGIGTGPGAIVPDPRAVDGQSCAAVLAEVLDAGFGLREFATIGPNQSTGIWYLQRR